LIKDNLNRQLEFNLVNVIRKENNRYIDNINYNLDPVIDKVDISLIYVNKADDEPSVDRK
jgi:hypothetical protein